MTKLYMHHFRGGPVYCCTVTHSKIMLYEELFHKNNTAEYNIFFFFFLPVFNLFLFWLKQILPFFASMSEHSLIYVRIPVHR